MNYLLIGVRNDWHFLETLIVNYFICFLLKAVPVTWTIVANDHARSIDVQCWNERNVEFKHRRCFQTSVNSNIVKKEGKISFGERSANRFPFILLDSLNVNETMARITAVMRHFLPWYHFTAVMRYFLPWYHFTAVMRHFLPWYHFTAVMRYFLP